MLLYNNIAINDFPNVNTNDAINNIVAPSLNEFTFPIFFTIDNITFWNTIHIINATIVIAVIWLALNPFTNVKNSVSIGTKNIKSPVNDANNGYIFILLFIFFVSCSICFSYKFSFISGNKSYKLYPNKMSKYSFSLYVSLIWYCVFE